MLVLVLDRVLDGDDVPGVAAVDLLDERRERRRLARTGRPADEDQARAAGCASGSTAGGRPSVASRGTRLGSRRTAAAARPRSRCRLMRKRPTPAIRNEASAMRASRYWRRACGASAGQHRLLDVEAVERPFGERDDLAVDANRRRRAGDEQQIAAVARGQQAEPALEPAAVADRRRPRLAGPTRAARESGARCRRRRARGDIAVVRSSGSWITSVPGSSARTQSELPNSELELPARTPTATRPSDHHRIDAGGAVRRDVAREQRHCRR